MAPAPASDARAVAVVAAVSGIYDIVLGLTLVLGRDLLVRMFAVPPPLPPIHADLNGLFLIAIGVGYWWPFRRPGDYRGYLWVMGPLLKGAGAATFILDHVARHSPSAFLLFAATDGLLALATLLVLLATRRPADRPVGPTRIRIQVDRDRVRKSQ